jgi:hypothetical protein
MRLLEITVEDKKTFIPIDKVNSISLDESISTVFILVGKKRFALKQGSAEEAVVKYSKLKGLFSENKPVVEL